MKKFAILGAAALLALTGCTEVAQDITYTIALVATQTTQLTAAAETTPTQTTAVQYDSVSLQVPEITRQDVSITLEAEDAATPEACSVAASPRLGYSGTGYLSGLSAQESSDLVMEAEIPTTQHYDITIVVGSNAECTCKIWANDEVIYTLTMDSTENFMRATIQGIFLTEGTCDLSIEPVDGVIDVDCIELVNNTSLYDDESVLADTPVNENASASAKALLQFLNAQYGEKIITGQYTSDSTNAELEEIYAVTGEYPLIRFDDLGAYSQNGGDASGADVISSSLAWAQSGGIVGLSWYWNALIGEATVYTQET